MKGGLGSAAITLPDGLVVAALVAVNAVGDVIDPATGKVVAGVRTDDGKGLADARTLLRSGALMRRAAAARRREHDDRRRRHQREADQGRRRRRSRRWRTTATPARSRRSTRRATATRSSRSPPARGPTSAEPDDHRRAGRGGDGRRDRPRGHAGERSPACRRRASSARCRRGSSRHDGRASIAAAFVRAVAGRCRRIAGFEPRRCSAARRRSSSPRPRCRRMPYGVAAGAAGPDRVRGLEPQRSPGADARRVRDHRALRRRAPRHRSGGAREHRLHRAHRAHGAAAPGSASSTACSSRTSPTCAGQPPRVGSFVTRAGGSGAARRHHRLVGRHCRPGLGHQSRLGRPAPLRDDAERRSPTCSSTAATRSTPTSRSSPK